MKFEEYFRLLEKIDIKNRVYHFTRLKTLFFILNSNSLYASDKEAKAGNENIEDIGISLARTLSAEQNLKYGDIGTDVAIELDLDKLRNKYRIKPYVFPTNRKFSKVELETTYEFEDRIYTQEVKNIKRYITGFYLFVNGKFDEFFKKPNILKFVKEVAQYYKIDTTYDDIETLVNEIEKKGISLTVKKRKINNRPIKKDSEFDIVEYYKKYTI